MVFVLNLGIIIDMDDFSAQHYRFGIVEKRMSFIKCRRVKLNWRYNRPEPWEDYPIEPPNYINVPNDIYEFEIDDWIDFHVEHPYCYTLESWDNPGELTGMGKRMHYLLGVYNRKRYILSFSQFYQR